MSARKVEKVIEPINAPFEQVVAKLVDSTASFAFFDVPKHYPHSPLRYPGGKNRAVGF